MTTSDRTAGGVRVRNLSKQFTSPTGEPLRVLDGVDIDVRPGEFVSIVGPSGCGKTTLLRIVQGLDEADSGEVLVDGQAPGDVATGFVFQRAALFPWRTVERNVSFGLDLRVLRSTANHPATRAGRRKRVADLLALTNLTDFADYYPTQISGGMQQRVNLARALAIQPSVLLMDEPFSALDAQTREKLQRDLQRVVAETRTTTLFITHDIREAVFQADRVFVMAARPGRFVEVFDIDEPHPRTAEFQQSDRLAETAREIWGLLHAKPAALTSTS
ncbi:ABC transporter ATP-binding protein [Pseudonocardia sp.]|jgi:NitT/TauT family transport system ATP-binding protein|uniref:ABC transporter ATP-binding protein n=1 Tax=Pseudonocardia sp. TaxID=60912 RepID=UPI00262613F8|nr:ABC transporter ATP-binding protein [Pseudonocardia sp.]MCW2716480.1 Hydroxymethylpyrimidine transporter, ATPase component [Pseudonocardia sp.]